MGSWAGCSSRLLHSFRLGLIDGTTVNIFNINQTIDEQLLMLKLTLIQDLNFHRETFGLILICYEEAMYFKSLTFKSVSCCWCRKNTHHLIRYKKIWREIWIVTQWFSQTLLFIAVSPATLILIRSRHLTNSSSILERVWRSGQEFHLLCIHGCVFCCCSICALPFSTYYHLWMSHHRVLILILTGETYLHCLLEARKYTVR